jgi:hypothetical protein
MIITEGFAQAELFNRFGMAIPDDEPPRPFGAVQLSVRLKEMRALGVRRAGRRHSFDYEAWLKIYAESFGKRYGRVDRLRIAHDARLACIPFSPDELDEAITTAEYALAADPTHSAYSVAMIGQALQVTLKERMDGLTHLGCCEETDEERAERRKAEKKAREAKRRKGVLSQEARAPWLDLGISRRTWFRLRQAERTARGTDSAPVIYKEESLTGAKVVPPEAQPQADEDRAHLKDALEVFFGPPTRPGAWPKPPPITASMQAGEASDGCEATVYKNTELDERLLPPALARVCEDHRLLALRPG